MFIPRSSPALPSSSVSIIVGVIIGTIVLVLGMVALFFYRTRRSLITSSDKSLPPAEKPLPPAEKPRLRLSPPTDFNPYKPRTPGPLRPLELQSAALAQVPRAYTPFSSLPPRWSPRHSPAPALAPAVLTEKDEMTIVPLHTPFNSSFAPTTARGLTPPFPETPRRYSSRAARRERDRTAAAVGGGGGYERLR